MPDYAKNYHQLIEVEAGGFNSTLAPYENCPNANNEIAVIGNTRFSGEFQNRTLSRAQERLAKELPGFNLTIADCFQMQQLCAYETVALGYSKFCGLFTEVEWEGFAYTNGMYVVSPL